MKKLFATVLMLFTISLVFGSQPEYDVGQENVKVFVKSLNGNVSFEAANVDLNTLEVVTPKQVFAKVTAFEIEGNMVAIKTVYNNCEHLYIAKKSTTDKNLVLAVPWKNTYEKNKTTISILHTHSSGGLPRMYI